MSPHVALLRGINVGGRNRLPMKALVAVFEGLGYCDARTLIQSGNVVFRAPDGESGAVAGRITREILARHGFEPVVVVLSASAFEDAVARNPFPTPAGKALHAYFLAGRPASPDLTRLAGLAADTERFELVGRVFYLLAPEGIGRSRLAPAVEAALGVAATARNWNTIMALAAMLRDT